MFRFILVFVASVLGGCAAPQGTVPGPRPVLVERSVFDPCAPPTGWEAGTVWAKGVPDAQTTFEDRRMYADQDARGRTCRYQLDAGSRRETRK